MSWLVKWLGIKALKVLVKKFILNKLLIPRINNVGNWIQEYVDDPDTDDDEKFVQSFKNFGKYFAKKQLDRI